MESTIDYEKIFNEVVKETSLMSKREIVKAIRMNKLIAFIYNEVFIFFFCIIMGALPTILITRKNDLFGTEKIVWFLLSILVFIPIFKKIMKYYFHNNIETIFEANIRIFVLKYELKSREI